ncbi:MAG: sigma-70 family RNA polymerase sigma factor [Ideonella sp.]|jgi:RNA polymerase sigma factor (TIGR02999 family)|nr:sigma-70 family RNA polymerase sigma factor [Ideonella sp.]
MSNDPEVAAAPGAAVDARFEATYHQLKRLAHARLRDGGRDVLLDTTGLVHETYLKLGQQAALQFPDNAHFLSYAGRVMRSVIIDLVRQRRSERHGGDLRRVTMTGDVMERMGVPTSEDHILGVHEALQEMAKLDERMARVVELRYFAGLSDLEIASALGITDRTVRRDWAHARLFLLDALG